jgi:hypothetical protein
MLALGELSAASDHQLYTRDLFYHQTRAVDYLRTLRKDPNLGEPVTVNDVDGKPMPIFEPGDNEVPLMWATHPTNFDREQNAMRHYLPSPSDDRSSWLLFNDGPAVREAVTRRYYEVVKELSGIHLAEPEVVQAFIDDEHAETTYDPRYHGMYENRFIMPGEVDALLEAAPLEFPSPGRLAAAQAALLGDDLKDRMEAFHRRQEEYNLLSGLVEGALEVKGKDFPFREGRYRATDARRLLGQVEKELDADNAWLAGVDRQVFLVHSEMARQLSAESYQELAERYRFHLALQDILNVLLDQQHRAQLILGQLSGERQLSEETFATVREVLREASAAFCQNVANANRLRLPVLKNMKAGESLGHFLMSRQLVHELTGGESNLDGQWITMFMQQLEEVLDRCRRIHFKSLGGILALQERIAAQWSAIEKEREEKPEPASRQD